MLSQYRTLRESALVARKHIGLNNGKDQKFILLTEDMMVGVISQVAKKYINCPNKQNNVTLTKAIHRLARLLQSLANTMKNTTRHTYYTTAHCFQGHNPTRDRL
jgi:hypothetical protein